MSDMVDLHYICYCVGGGKTNVTSFLSALKLLNVWDRFTFEYTSQQPNINSKVRFTFSTSILE